MSVRATKQRRRWDIGVPGNAGGAVRRAADGEGWAATL